MFVSKSIGKYPICKHCIYFIKNDAYYNNFGEKYAKCRNFGEQNLVSGEITYHYASTCREFDHLCGEKGRKFKEIIPQNGSKNK